MSWIWIRTLFELGLYSTLASINDSTEVIMWSNGYRPLLSLPSPRGLWITPSPRPILK